MDNLAAIEQAAIDRLGPEKLRAMAGMLSEFNQALDRAMEETSA